MQHRPRRSYSALWKAVRVAERQSERAARQAVLTEALGRAGSAAAAGPTSATSLVNGHRSGIRRFVSVGAGPTGERSTQAHGVREGG